VWSAPNPAQAILERATLDGGGLPGSPIVAACVSLLRALLLRAAPAAGTLARVERGAAALLARPPAPAPLGDAGAGDEADAGTRRALAHLRALAAALQAAPARAATPSAASAASAAPPSPRRAHAAAAPPQPVPADVFGWRWAPLLALPPALRPMRDAPVCSL
jgi:hypothetical protein